MLLAVSSLFRGEFFSFSKCERMARRKQLSFDGKSSLPWTWREEAEVGGLRRLRPKLAQSGRRN